ncbi:MAG: glycosyltransferase [Acidobacteria bacterium]|nr:glycosyltransferase [Acidobacteriota bacterium]
MAALTRRRPRLLFLCQTLPYPPDGGVWIRTYHVLRILARAFDITALCFERATRGAAGAAHAADAAVAALRAIARVERFPLPQRGRPLRFAWDHMRSLSSGRVYTTYLYDSRAFAARLAHELATQKFDLVHVDSLDLARFLPACRGRRVAVVHHDIESELLARRAAVERAAWTRAYLRYQARLMRAVERYWSPRVDLNVVCSERDASQLRAIAPRAGIEVVPNGVDLDAMQPGEAAGRGIVYVGGTSPFPNLDALEYFCSEILPAIRRRRPDEPVRWIGRATADQQNRARRRFGVELTGYVDDAIPPMRSAACHIAPLRLGGGTRLKILHAWALGKPVVGTSIACEGLAAEDGLNALVRDAPAAFADAVVDVLDNPALARQLGSAGRDTALRRYGWEAIGARLTDTYLRLAGSKPDAAARDANASRRHTAPAARA